MRTFFIICAVFVLLANIPNWLYGKGTGEKWGYESGTWVRVHVLRLPPIEHKDK